MLHLSARVVRAITAALLLTVTACVLAVPAFARTGSGEASPDIPAIAFSALPVDAQRTARLVREGGPFPYERDGVAFGNFERLLPRRERGYYREYTVPTPGVRHRGARRLVVGRLGELYYTSDHYASFSRVRE